MDEVTRQQFLDELCPQIRPLIARLMDCACGCEILELFRRRPLTSLQASDIAYHLRLPQPQVIEGLSLLVDAGVIECRGILDFTFYGLTHDSEIQRALEQFWVWRDHWRTRLERVRSGLQLNAPYPSSATVATP